MTQEEHVVSAAAYSHARREIIEACKSPIERRLAEALMEWERLEEYPYLVEARDVENLAVARDIMGTPVIAPQVSVHRYRVDFLAMIRETPDWRTGASGMMLAFECDGHQFHERTPEQAERDRKRDRDLFELGIPTLRFTGREIVRDAQACAETIRDVIRQRWAEVAWNEYQKEALEGFGRGGVS